MADKTMAPMCAAAGIDWGWTERMVNHVVNLLESQGSAIKETVTDLLRAIRLFTGRDMKGVFDALGEVSDDVSGIIKAVKEEFGL